MGEKNPLAYTGLVSASTTKQGDAQFNADHFTTNEGVVSLAASPIVGQSTLVAGTVTVAQPSVTANSRIILSRTQVNSSVSIGFLVSSITPGVSFTVDSLDSSASAQAADVSTFNFYIVKQN